MNRFFIFLLLLFIACTTSKQHTPDLLVEKTAEELRTSVLSKDLKTLEKLFADEVTVLMDIPIDLQFSRSSNYNGFIDSQGTLFEFLFLNRQLQIGVNYVQSLSFYSVLQKSPQKPRVEIEKGNPLYYYLVYEGGNDHYTFKLHCSDSGVSCVIVDIEHFNDLLP